MKNIKAEIQTIITFLEATSIADDSNFSKIKSELNEVISDHKLEKQGKKNLLKIVHTTRALDTSLKVFLTHHSILGSAYSLGQYLYRLKDHNSNDVDTISERERRHYQTEIVDLRNDYMHNAGKIATNESEVNNLISNMHILLKTVAGLE